MRPSKFVGQLRAGLYRLETNAAVVKPVFIALTKLLFVISALVLAVAV